MLLKMLVPPGEGAQQGLKIHCHWLGLGWRWGREGLFYLYRCACFLAVKYDCQGPGPFIC